MEVLPPDRFILVDARVRDGLPSPCIQAERPSELIILAPWCIVQHRRRIRRRTAERVRERLVLCGDGRNGVRGGDVGPLEVGRCKVGDAVSDGGGQLGDRFLNLGRVVVGLGLVRLGDPVGVRGSGICGCASRCDLT